MAATKTPPSGHLPTKRQYVLVLLVIGAASALAWWATSASWAVAEEALLGDSSGQFASAVSQASLNAAAIAPAAAAMPILGFAGLAGVLGSRGWVRRIVGLVLVGAGVVLAWAGLNALISLEVQAKAPSGGELVAVSPEYPALTAIAGVALAISGAATLVFGASWPTLGSNYERANDGPRDAWEAMDAGVDPTQEPPRAEDPHEVNLEQAEHDDGAGRT